MRYRVRGREIRTENAAKPASQASSYLLDWLKNLSKVPEALDYGCGKLRYSETLAERCGRLTVVDSKIQLNRMQLLFGEQTSAREVVQDRWPNVRALTIEEFLRDEVAYDFVLCANVLSAIPSEEARARALEGILASLTTSGEALFVTQYANSYFKIIAEAEDSFEHLDGWIKPSPRGAAYYGILNRERLSTLLADSGFAVKRSWRQGQSAYVLVTTGP